MPDLSPDPQTLRRGLRTLLMTLAADAEGTARAAGRLYERLISQLVPLIGQEGVRALCARARHLTEMEFPWLALSGDGTSDDCSTGLRASLADRRLDQAAEAASAFIATFCGLVAGLMGGLLATRLLHNAWAEVFQAGLDRDYDRKSREASNSGR